MRADFLDSQAGALPACGFVKTTALSGQHQHVLAAIEHATRRVLAVGTTAHAGTNRVTKAIKNLAMDLDAAGCRARFLLRGRDAKFSAIMNEILAQASIQTVPTGIRIPWMNSAMDRWVQTCRCGLLGRCLPWNERRLRHVLGQYENFYNQHRSHQALSQAAPLRAAPIPITNPALSSTCTSTDTTGSEEFSTNFHMPIDLHGRNFGRRSTDQRMPESLLTNERHHERGRSALSSPV